MTELPGTVLAEAASRLAPGRTYQTLDWRTWIASVDLERGRASLRALDPRIPSSRLALMHEFLGQPMLEGSTPLVAVESIETWTFDLRQWAAGEVLGLALPGPPWDTHHLPASLARADIELIAGALAQFHRSGTSPSLLARVPRFKVRDALAATRHQIETRERQLGSELRKESSARRWLTLSRTLFTTAATNLEHVDFLRDEPSVIAHLDLWGSHIARTETGHIRFLDCSQIGAAPAIVDMARLLARTTRWDAETTELALARYSETNRIGPIERRSLPWLAALDGIATGGALLVKLDRSQRDMPDHQRRAVAESIDQELSLLQALVDQFVPPPARRRRFTPKPRSRSSD